MMPPVILPPPLVQEAPAPLVAPKVIDLLTGLVATVTQIPATLVRPRWQRLPPQQPPANVDWASVGVTRRAAQGYSHQEITFLPGTTTQALLERRWAALECLVSFYGPNSEDLSEQFRDSVLLVQNLAGIYAYGIKVTGVGDITSVPDLTNYQWIDHVDVPFDLVREFDRYFPMQSLVEANGTLVSDLPYSEALDSNEAAPAPQTPAQGG